MKAQIIEKQGKKEFAVIPYKEFFCMQDELEDYQDLRAIRSAKADPKNQQGRSFAFVAKELGLKRKKSEQQSRSDAVLPLWMDSVMRNRQTPWGQCIGLESANYERSQPVAI